MKNTLKYWYQLIKDNLPLKYQNLSKVVGLFNKEDGSDWNGFDFSIKHLPSFYDGQKYLSVYIYEKNEIIDRIQIKII